MKNVMLAEPATLVLFGGVIFFLLFLLALIGAAVFLIVHFSRKSRKPAPPSASPAAPAAQTTPRQCPQCGAELKPDVSEGLCPACLLQRGIATEGGAPPGTPPFTPPTIPDLAKLFPQLEILELIGKGGMGAVYKARQPALDRYVALKILAPRSGGDLDFAERFTREARALAKLSHPNIVAVYDFGQAGGLSYFIMEHVDGPNLRQVEQAGRLSPREALEIIPQICGALQFAHDEGIVHRDIKPENVLLDKKGRVKIADFGLAKILGQEPKDFRLTGARDVVGTPHYMAPEQIEKPSEVDHRADIYSLGVVFYEMLTGELPLGKFQPPSSCAGGMQIDVRLDEVVLHSLEKEPARRYQHVSEVKTRVETIAQTAGERNRFPSAALQYNPLEIKMAVGATIFIVAMFFVALGFALEYPRQAGAPLIVMGMCVIGLSICGLNLAGLWPFTSPQRPDPSFGSRNLRRGKSPSAPTGGLSKVIPIVAKVGFAWIVLSLSILGWFGVWAFVRSDLKSTLNTVPILQFGFVAAVVSTACGWLAVHKIRNSHGKLGGLGLALFDGLLFPLLVWMESSLATFSSDSKCSWIG